MPDRAVHACVRSAAYDARSARPRSRRLPRGCRDRAARAPTCRALSRCPRAADAQEDLCPAAPSPLTAGRRLSGPTWATSSSSRSIALVALGFAASSSGRCSPPAGHREDAEIAGGGPGGRAGVPAAQFRTLAVFVVIALVLLFLLPGRRRSVAVKIGRSVFFIVGAVFSALIGYLGMTLATRANLRVAAAAREADGGARRPCASRSAPAAWSA